MDYEEKNPTEEGCEEKASKEERLKHLRKIVKEAMDRCYWDYF